MPGSLALIKSLQLSGSIYPVVCLTRDVSSVSKQRLSSAGAEVLEITDEVFCEVDDEPRGATFDKLHIWNQLEYDKGVYIDSDCVVLQNVDELFDRDELSACVPSGERYFNSGVMVFKPSGYTYRQLVDRLRRGEYSPDVKTHTEQDLLIEHFFSQGSVQDLPYRYNARPIHGKKNYLPGKADHRIIHYVGNPKPWGSIPGNEASLSDQQVSQLSDSMEIWKEFYNE